MSIVIKNLSYTYSQGTPYEQKALDDVNLTVNDGEFLGIIGHTGCGKSTLLQHLNGLIPVQSGDVIVNGISLAGKKPDYKSVRKIVGLVFQYPEHQLFAETVAEDVAFGPRNLGVTGAELEDRVQKAITLVGLDYNAVKDKSPFDLSGGQKRRVALAGVISMHPQILVLDEPTAGLDPLGKKEILELVSRLRKYTTPTVVMISHNMDEIADIADRIAVMKDGKLLACLPPRELFNDDEIIKKGDLELPAAVQVAKALKERGIDVGMPVRKSELSKNILALYGRKNNA